ncbi:MAG: zf-HC2 domain-containing protein [Pseudomonadota bacterium]
MDCKEAKEKLSAYMDAELDADGRREVDGHLETCERCSHELQRMEAVWELIAGVETPEPPAHMPDKITAGLSRAGETAAGRVAWRTLLGWPMNAAAALAVAAGIVLGFVLGMFFNAGSDGQSMVSKAPAYEQEYTEDYAEAFSELPAGSPGYYLVEFVSNGEKKDDSPEEDRK